MDLYDYGPQPTTQMPVQLADAYDITPFMTAAMKHIKVGCGTSS